MTVTDKKAPAQKPGDKVVRMCPDNELKGPKMAFEDTFSAEKVVMQTFFPGK
jgi:hypothetical protein